MPFCTQIIKTKNTNINLLENSIFRDDSRFNCFKDIDEETKQKITLLAQKFINTKFGDNKLENYLEVLLFLNSSRGRFSTNPNGHTLFFRTYDEVVLFYIYCCDPDLITYKNSIFLDNNSQSYINNATRKELGFYNEKLLKYEKILFLETTKNLVTGVRNKNTAYLTLIISTTHSFEKTTPERFSEIKLLAEKWIKNQIKGTELQTCSYNLVNQSDLLKLNSVEEKVIFFISALDPELEALSIYEEESRISSLKKRINEVLGFYYDNLFKLEQLYSKKFIPEKDSYSWTKKKML